MPSAKNFLINRPMFKEDFLKVGQGITVIKGNVRIDCLVSEIEPLNLKVLYLDGSKVKYLDVNPEEVFKKQAVFIFGRK